jgi:hypothetical protein
MKVLAELDETQIWEGGNVSGGAFNAALGAPRWTDHSIKSDSGVAGNIPERLKRLGLVAAS